MSNLSKEARWDYMNKINQCINEGAYLTKWEENFLESLLDKVEGAWQEPSEREIEKLDQIFVEKVR